MNWTGGRLQRHSRNTDTVEKRQRRHFSNIRKRQLNTHRSGVSPSRPSLHTRKDPLATLSHGAHTDVASNGRLSGDGPVRQSRLDEYESLAPVVRRLESMKQRLDSNRPAYQESSMSKATSKSQDSEPSAHGTMQHSDNLISVPGRDKGAEAESPRDKDDGEFQQKKLHLLNQGDWAGLRLTRPLLNKHSGRLKKEEFGKGRKVHPRQVHRQIRGATQDDYGGDDIRSESLEIFKTTGHSDRSGHFQNLGHPERVGHCKASGFSRAPRFAKAHGAGILPRSESKLSRALSQDLEAIQIRIGSDALYSTQPCDLRNNSTCISIRSSDSMLLDGIQSPVAPLNRFKAAFSDPMLLNQRQSNTTAVSIEPNEGSPCPQNSLQEDGQMSSGVVGHTNCPAQVCSKLPPASGDQFRSTLDPSLAHAASLVSLEEDFPVKLKKAPSPTSIGANRPEGPSSAEQLIPERKRTPIRNLTITSLEDGCDAQMHLSSKVDGNPLANTATTKESDADELWRRFVFGNDHSSNVSEHLYSLGSPKLEMLGQSPTTKTFPRRLRVGNDPQLQHQFSDAQSQSTSLAANCTCSEMLEPERIPSARLGNTYTHVDSDTTCEPNIQTAYDGGVSSIYLNDQREAESKRIIFHRPAPFDGRQSMHRPVAHIGRYARGNGMGKRNKWTSQSGSIFDLSASDDDEIED